MHPEARFLQTQIISPHSATTASLPSSLLTCEQVSVDVPWSPYDVDGRNYDWAGLAAAADIFFVMAYDTQSQVRVGAADEERGGLILSTLLATSTYTPLRTY